jgi:hypothetical protein
VLVVKDATAASATRSGGNGEQEDDEDDESTNSGADDGDAEGDHDDGDGGVAAKGCAEEAEAEDEKVRWREVGGGMPLLHIDEMESSFCCMYASHSSSAPSCSSYCCSRTSFSEQRKANEGNSRAPHTAQRCNT